MGKISLIEKRKELIIIESEGGLFVVVIAIAIITASIWVLNKLKDLSKWSVAIIIFAVPSVITAMAILIGSKYGVILVIVSGIALQIMAWVSGGN